MNFMLELEEWQACPGGAQDPVPGSSQVALTILPYNAGRRRTEVKLKGMGSQESEVTQAASCSDARAAGSGLDGRDI